MNAGSNATVSGVVRICPGFAIEVIVPAGRHNLPSASRRNSCKKLWTAQNNPCSEFPVIVTFPGEAFVEVGLRIKEKSPYENTFLAAYTNGIIAPYAPTAEDYNGWAYEDNNTILASDWEKIYEQKILQIINKL